MGLAQARGQLAPPQQVEFQHRRLRRPVRRERKGRERRGHRKHRRDPGVEGRPGTQEARGQPSLSRILPQADSLHGRAEGHRQRRHPGGPLQHGRHPKGQDGRLSRRTDAIRPPAHRLPRQRLPPRHIFQPLPDVHAHGRHRPGQPLPQPGAQPVPRVEGGHGPARPGIHRQPAQDGPRGEQPVRAGIRGIYGQRQPARAQHLRGRVRTLLDVRADAQVHVPGGPGLRHRQGAGEVQRHTAHAARALPRHRPHAHRLGMARRHGQGPQAAVGRDGRQHARNGVGHQPRRRLGRTGQPGPGRAVRGHLARRPPAPRAVLPHRRRLGQRAAVQRGTSQLLVVRRQRLRPRIPQLRPPRHDCDTQFRQHGRAQPLPQGHGPQRPVQAARGSASHRHLRGQLRRPPQERRLARRLLPLP